jgi:hypothetical protein
MKKMKEMLEEQEKIIEELEMLKIKVQKKTQDAESITEKISQIKEQQDYGSFKFVLVNKMEILEKVAKKHIIPKPREINISSCDNNPTAMTASIPWSDEVCSDSNPCNVGVCERCTLLHFFSVLDKLLAGYYAK